MMIKTVKTDDVLKVYLSGRIDSNNAQQTENDISADIAKYPGEVPVFDAEGLEYISSAGLRVLLKFRKQFSTKLDVINVSSDVYDIFSVTGFNELLNVKKKLREVSIEGCPVIGGGTYSTVYRLDPETIIKVYDKHNSSLEKIESEQKNSREVFLHDIPTAIAYDIVRIGGLYGSMYEMLDAGTVSATLRQHPERLEELSLKTAHLMKKLHTTEFEPGTFPDSRDICREYTAKLHELGLITAEENTFLNTALDRIPYKNTFVHGDFHPNNIMVCGGDLMLIDIGDASLGDPMFDLGISYTHFIRLSRSSAEHGLDVHERVIGLNHKVWGAMWEIIIPEYFGTSDREILARNNELISNYSSFLMMEMLPVMLKSPASEGKKAVMKQIVSSMLEAADKLTHITM